MESCSLPRKTLMLWRIRIGMLAVAATAAAAFLCFASWWFLLLVGLIAAVFAVIMLWYLPKYLQSYVIKFSNTAIIINRGVFIRTSHIMPFSRMVYTQSYTTPIARYIGLSGLILRAARSMLVIPELERQDALNIIRNITEEGMS